MMDYTVSFQLKSAETQENCIFIVKLLLGILREQNRLTIVNGLVRRALLRTSCLGLTFREESGASY